MIFVENQPFDHDSTSSTTRQYTKQKAYDNFHNQKSETVSLQKLQRELLLNGYNSLRPGGYLIYSTCSSSQSENEDIIQWLLNEAINLSHKPILIPCPENIIEYHSYDDKNNHVDINSNIFNNLILKNLDDYTDCDIEIILTLSDESLIEFFGQKQAKCVTNVDGDANTSINKWMSLFSCKVASYLERRSKFPVIQGELPGTVKCSRHVGMSGLFVAVIQKDICQQNL